MPVPFGLVMIMQFIFDNASNNHWLVWTNTSICCFLAHRALEFFTKHEGNVDYRQVRSNIISQCCTFPLSLLLSSNLYFILSNMCVTTVPGLDFFFLFCYTIYQTTSNVQTVFINTYTCAQTKHLFFMKNIVSIIYDNLKITWSLMIVGDHPKEALMFFMDVLSALDNQGVTQRMLVSSPGFESS